MRNSLQHERVIITNYKAVLRGMPNPYLYNSLDNLRSLPLTPARPRRILVTMGKILFQFVRETAKFSWAEASLTNM